MVVPFAFLSVGRGAWLKCTIRWNALLFEWRDFSTKPCSCKGTDYWSTSLWTLPFLLTEQPFSLLVAQYQLLKDIHIAAHLRVLCSPHPIFLTLPPLTSFVIFWAVVESLLLSYSYNLCCTYHTVTRQAEVALPLCVSILKSLFSTMTIGTLPYAMPRGQVLEVSTSRNAYMAHTRSRSL